MGLGMPLGSTWSVSNSKDQQAFMCSWGLLPFNKDDQVTVTDCVVHAQFPVVHAQFPGCCIWDHYVSFCSEEEVATPSHIWSEAQSQCVRQQSAF